MIALTPAERALLVEQRRATLVTIAPDGRPRPVPCCFAVSDVRGPLVIDTPIDAKPKRHADPARLARVRDIARDPRVSLLVDRWDEDWTRLAWLRLVGMASLLVPGNDGHAAAVVALRARYPQYQGHRLESLPVIRIVPERVTFWEAATGR